MNSRTLTLLLLVCISYPAKSQCFLVPAQVCEGDCGPLFYLQNDPDGTTYQWSISCGTITNPTSANPHTVCFDTSGTCTIQVIIEAPGETPDTCSMEVEVMPLSYTDINEGVCEGDSVEINGTYYTTGMFTDTIFGGSATGCDSILLITVSLIPADTTDFLYNGCEADSFSIIVNGNVYNESNPTGSELLTGSDGCDSLVNISLVFNPHT